MRPAEVAALGLAHPALLLEAPKRLLQPQSLRLPQTPRPAEDVEDVEEDADLVLRERDHNLALDPPTGALHLLLPLPESKEMRLSVDVEDVVEDVEEEEEEDLDPHAPRDLLLRPLPPLALLLSNSLLSLALTPPVHYIYH
jgi:hypothetical protein